MTEDLADIRALVTGTASGIGSAIAAACVDAGAEVLGLDRNAGGPVPVIKHDLADVGAIDAVVSRVIEQLGRVDLLVNCAGMFKPEDARALTRQAFEETQRVNLHSPIFLMSHLGAAMASRGFGRIVNVSSIHGRLGEPLSTAYDVSKAGLEAATRSFAIELAPFGVLVNAVAPGFVATPMSEVDGVSELESPWFRDIYVSRGRIPLRRAATASEVASHVVFLGSRRNTYVTGQVLNVDGGLSATF